VEGDYSRLRPGEKKILYSLLHSKEGLRFNALVEKTGLSRRSLTEDLEKLLERGLITKSGRFAPYVLSAKGMEVTSRLNITPFIEEEVMRDVERGLAWIPWQHPYDTPTLWQLFHPLLDNEFSKLLVHYSAKLYVGAVRTRTPSNPETLKLHVEKIWRIIDTPTQQVLDQTFDWPKAVKETLAEVDNEVGVSKGRHLEALQLVRAALEKYSEKLFQDIKVHTQNPVRWHARAIIENFIRNSIPKLRMYPTFVTPPTRKYPIIFSAGGFMIYSFFLIWTGIVLSLGGLTTFFSIKSWPFGQILGGTLPLYGGTYLAIGLLLPVAAISLLYRQKWGSLLGASLLIANLLTDLTLGPAIGTTVLVPILLLLLIKGWRNLS